MLAADIEGNGHHESKNAVGTKGEMDAGSGYQSKDLSNENNDDNGSEGRGEDLDVTARYVMYDKDGNVTTDESKAVRKVDQSDTKDIQNAKNLNTYTYTGDPEDAVIARITDRAIVSGSYVTVEASQPVSVDMIGAAVGVGYAAGVGVSTVTATLRSNVLASSMGEINSRYITVAAKSNTGDAYRGKDAEDRKNAIGDLLQGAASDEGQAIRVIAATMSAAAVGIGVANGTLNTDNITSATLGGRVNDVRSLNITADHDFDNVLMGRELETLLPMRIVLRGHHIDGADLPVYSLTDRFFAMCDGTDGEVSLFDGFYTNTFDGDTFDSDYIRIEGGLDGDLNVIIKEDQPIWPEWIGDDEAEDIVGNHYTRQDNVWYNSDGIPIPEDARTV